jgi:hypothetical protein
MSFQKLLRELGCSLDGPSNHLAREDQRRKRTVINYNEGGEDEPIPPQIKHKQAKDSVTQPHAPQKIWQPNAAGTIGIYSHNRRREQLTPNEIAEIRGRAIRKQHAVIVFQETASLGTEAKDLAMPQFHSFHASTYADKEALTQAAIDLKTSKIRDKLAQPNLDPLVAKQHHLELDQATNSAIQNPHQLRNGGIAIYVSQHVFPEATVLLTDPCYLVVRLRDTTKKTLLLTAIYAPATRLENRKFFSGLREKLTALLTTAAYANTPLLLVGDMNALAQPPTGDPRTTLAVLMEALELRDAALDSDTPDPSPTHTASNGGRKSRIDMFLYNEAFRQKWASQGLRYKKHSPQESKDHDPISLHFHAMTTHASAEPRVTFTRTLTEEQRKLLSEMRV